MLDPRRLDTDAQEIAATLAWHRRCGPGCAVGIHEEIVWISISDFTGRPITAEDEPLLRESLSGELRVNFKASLLDYRPAPEGTVRPPGQRRSGHWVGTDGLPNPRHPERIAEDDLPPSRPVVVRFMVPWSLGALRRLFYGEE